MNEIITHSTRYLRIGQHLVIPLIIHTYSEHTSWYSDFILQEVLVNLNETLETTLEQEKDKKLRGVACFKPQLQFAYCVKKRQDVSALMYKDAGEYKGIRIYDGEIHLVIEPIPEMKRPPDFPGFRYLERDVY